MIFSVAYNFADQLSGIEHSQIQRHNAFNKNRETNSKLVSLAYNRFLTRALDKNAVKYVDFVNLFDYFQGTSGMGWNIDIRCSFKDLLKKYGFDKHVDLEKQNCIVINNALILSIHLMDNPIFEGQINYVEYFDSDNKLIQVDYYDIRGFKSMSDIIGQNGGVARQLNYNIQGDIVLETSYKAVDERIISTSWILYSQKHAHYFDNKDDLESYFLDEINIKNECSSTNIFISDRAFMTDAALFKMKTNRWLYVYWHNTFVPDGQKARESKPYDTLLEEIKYQDKISGLIVPTNQEKEDLEYTLQRYNSNIKVFKVNNAVINFKKDADTQNGHRIVTVARLSPEKRLNIGIKMFRLVKNMISDATWDIYGYGDESYKSSLVELIHQNNLEKSITIHDYQNDLESVYENSSLFWLPSAHEGFNLSVLEAMSNAIPVIAFDIEYGPREIIKDGINGYLIDEGNLKKFSERTISLFKNDTDLTNLGTVAFESVRQYDESQMVKQWLTVFAHNTQ